MPKQLQAYTYNVSTDMETEFFYNGETYNGTFTVKMVGGEHDGQVICCGPAAMAPAITGMLRMAAWTHAQFRSDAETLDEILMGNGPRNLDEYAQRLQDGYEITDGEVV